MRRAILALGCILLSQISHAQAVEIVPTWSGVAATDPRSTLTLVVQIRNTLPDSRRIGVEVDLPPGWRRFIPDTPAVVEPGASSPRIISLFVPQEAEAGDFRLRATAVEIGTEAILGYLDFDVRVHPHLELQIDGLDGSTHVLAGELIELPFRVANRSNTELSVTLTLETRSFYSAEFVGAPEGKLTLESNQSARVVARVRTPSVISRVEDYKVEVVATGRPSNGGFDTGGSARASFQAVVEIIPVVSEEPAPFHTIPAMIEGATTHDFGPGWNGNLRMNFSGGGYLDDAARHRLDFRIAPSVDLNQLSFTPEDDTYRVNYSSERVDMFVGDNGHEISPLLGTYRNGRGILARYKPGQFQFAGLYYFPPAIGPSESTVAVMSDFRIPDPGIPIGYRYRTALNGLSLIGSDFLVGNHHELFFGQNAGAEVDLAGGSTAGTPFVWGASVAGEVSLTSAQLSGLGLYTAPGFPGSNGDQVALTASAATMIEPFELSLGARSSFRQENLSRAAPVAAQTISVAANGGIALSRFDGQFTAGWELKSRKDLMPAPAFHQIDNSLTARTRFPIGNVVLGLDAKFDLDREALFDVWTVGQRYNFTARLAATPETTYNANLSIFGQRSTEFPTDRRVTAGLFTNQNWGPVATVARAGIGVSTRDQTFARFSSFLAGEAEVSVWGEHTILLEGYLQYNRDTASSGLSGGFTLGYTAPVRVPTSKQRGIGSVEGFVFDAGTGEPAESVVIRAADRAVVTGPEGVFRLSSLHVGEYYLEVDASRHGRGVIPDLPTPIKIPIRSNETTYIDLPIVRGASITGSVAVYAAPDAEPSLLSTVLDDDEGEYEEDELVSVSGLAGAVVHFSRDDELRRVLTDRNGNFTLSDMRPGRWTVSIGNAQLPRYHRLVQDEFEVIIEPGDEVTITFQIFPIRRPVTMLSVSDTPITIVTTPEEPAEEPPPVDDGVRVELVRLAETRYVQPRTDSPRLLSVPWGSSPEAASQSLIGRLSGEFEEIARTSVSETITTVTYSADGRFLLGLAGTVEFIFLDLGDSAPHYYLVGAAIRFTGQENLRTIEQMEPMYREMVALFTSRWKSEELETDSESGTEILGATIGDIGITYSFDENDGSIRVEYVDDWYVRAEQSIIESVGE